MQDAELIEEVRQHEELFDKTNLSYTDFARNDEIWKKISEKFRCDAKKKWRCLRDRYVRERKKVLNAPFGTTGKYQSDWSLYPLLEFLDDSIRPRKKTNNNTNYKYSCSKSDIVDEEAILSPFEEVSTCSTQYRPAYDPLISPSSTEERDILPLSFRKRRKVNDDDIKTFIVDAIEDLHNRIKGTQDDEDDLYLRIIKIKMSKMSEDDKSNFKKELLGHAEMYIRRNSK